MVEIYFLFAQLRNSVNFDRSLWRRLVTEMEIFYCLIFKSNNKDRIYEETRSYRSLPSGFLSLISNFFILAMNVLTPLSKKNSPILAIKFSIFIKPLPMFSLQIRAIFHATLTRPSPTIRLKH